MSVESLAEALLGAGILDASSVEQRVPRARTGRQLLEGVIGDGLVTEKSLVTQLARALSVPRYDPGERQPEPEAVALLDRRVVADLGVLPVALRGGGALLWVALCDPTDEATLAEVMSACGRRVKPCLIGPREFDRALKQLASLPRTPLPTQAFPSAAATATGHHPAVPMPSAGYPVPTMVGPGLVPGQTPGAAPYPYAAGMTQQMMSALAGGMPAMQQHLRPQTPPQTMPSMPGFARPGGGAGELQKLEEELAQARQVVRVLAQMLVEKGLLDGDELKQRLRAERERK